mgnify:CR=1 FL=1
MRVQTYPEAQTPPVLRRQVLAMQEDAWPSTGPGDPIDPGPVHDPALRPLSMLLVEDDTVLAALDILFTPITHAGVTLSAAGLSTVVTASAHRRHGHGRRLVTRARDKLPALDADLGLFTCDRYLSPFYLACGWELLPGTVLIGGTRDEPFPSDQPGFDKVTFATFITPTAIAARASLLGARVELYCGAIDMLW